MMMNLGHRYLLLTAALFFSGTSVAIGQSQSPITVPLHPMGQGNTNINSDVTADGEWVYFFDNLDALCNLPLPKQISRMRTDGTGYEVVISQEELEEADANPSGGSQISMDRVTISNDATRGYFKSTLGSTLGCVLSTPVVRYWYDPTNGKAGQLTEGLYHATTTNDGRTCFGAFDFETKERTVRIGSAIDGSDAVAVYTAPPGTSMIPTISGNGETVVLRIAQGGPPYEGDIHLLDVATGVAERLTFFNNPLISRFDISDDGTRVVFTDDLEGAVYRMFSDGTGLERVGELGSTSLQISGDGEYIMHAGSSTEVARTRFDLSESISTPMLFFFDTFVGNFTGRGMADDGSVMTGITPNEVIPGEGIFAFPLGSWTDSPVALFTSGFATCGTPLRIDVGGPRFSNYILGMSLDGASVPVGPLGTLTLDPSSFQVLAMGTIGNNALKVASHTFDIPDALSAPLGLDVHFQALVSPPTGQAMLTNGTVLTIRDYDISPFDPPFDFGKSNDPAAALTASPRGNDDALRRTGIDRFRAELARLPIPPSPTPPNGPEDLTPEQRLAIEIVTDPGYWYLYKDTVYQQLMHGYAADSPEVREMWQAPYR